MVYVQEPKIYCSNGIMQQKNIWRKPESNSDSKTQAGVPT